MVTDPLTNPQTGPITIHCAAASAQCKKAKKDRQRNRYVQKKHMFNAEHAGTLKITVSQR